MLVVSSLSGDIMEGTITTVYFRRDDGQWITPAERCAGHLGTTRRWALEKGLCKEGSINAKDLKQGDVIILSNGVRGFGWGVIDGPVEFAYKESLKDAGPGGVHSISKR